MKRSTVNILVGICFILAGLSITAYNLWSDWNAGNTSAQALKIIIENEEKSKERVSYGEEIIPDYTLNPQMDMPEKEIGDKRYIGYLDMPTINKKLPVLNELTDSNLNIAPCRYKGSIYLDNMIIAAHNFSSHFGNIARLNLGDKFTFTDIDGNVFEYKVVDFEKLKGNQVQDMEAGEWDLSLFTCTLDGASRVTIRCEKSEIQ